MTDMDGYWTNHSYARTRPTAWEVTSIPGSGQYVCTTGGTKLFRVGDGCVYFWDKFTRAEVEISVEHLVRLAGAR